MKCCGKFMLYDQHEGEYVCDVCYNFFKSFAPVLNYPELDKITCSFIETVCANNHIYKCIERDALKKFRQRKDRSQAFGAFCIYHACKIHKVGRTLSETAAMCFVSVPEISKYDRECSIEILPSQLTARFCANLNITLFKVQKKISRIADMLYSKLLLGSPPQSAIALAIYVLSQIYEKDSFPLKLSLQSIAETCGVSTNCIRRLFKVYKEELFELVPLCLEPAKNTQLRFYE